MDILRTETLPNGLKVEFLDRSNRYYGDFHRVRIEVSCRIALNETLFRAAAEPSAEYRRARDRFGDELVYTRILEKMGVAGDQLAAVKGALIDAFAGSTLPYLEKPGFSLRFVQRELERAGKLRRLPVGTA